MKASFGCLLFSAQLLPTTFTSAQVAVVTYQNDNYRSGANANETILTPNNVNPALFGRLTVFNVTGFVYAQPLYVPNVGINDALRNVLCVATEHDQVYAFDVNSGRQLWTRNLLIGTKPYLHVTPVSSSDVNCDDMVPEIGITGTPVIAFARSTIGCVITSSPAPRKLPMSVTSHIQNR